MLRRMLSLGLVALLCATVFQAGAGDVVKREEPKYSNLTYVPTADEVIEKMFEMAKVGKDDVIFDLGCGDARILYQAAKKFGTRGVGLDINTTRIREAMDQADKYKVGTLVEVRHGDALKPKDLADASVVTLYMFPEFMDLWLPNAREHLKPGTRIVSHDYKFTKKWDPADTDPKQKDGWAPAAEQVVRSTMRDNHKVLLWVVPYPKK